MSRGHICQRNISLSRCQKNSYPPPPQRNIALSPRLLSRGHTKSTQHFFVALPKKFIPPPLKETLLCLLDFCREATLGQRNISLSRCQKNSYPPPLKGTLSCPSRLLSRARTKSTQHFFVALPKKSFPPSQRNIASSLDFSHGPQYVYATFLCCVAIQITIIELS